MKKQYIAIIGPYYGVAPYEQLKDFVIPSTFILDYAQAKLALKEELQIRAKILIEAFKSKKYRLSADQITRLKLLVTNYNKDLGTVNNDVLLTNLENKTDFFIRKDHGQTTWISVLDDLSENEVDDVFQDDINI